MRSPARFRPVPFVLVALVLGALACGLLRAGRAGDAPPIARDGSSLVYVAPGPFTMGSDAGETDEQPAHRVVLPGFWIGRYLVTNQQFATFLNAQGNRLVRGQFWYDLCSPVAGITSRARRFEPAPGLARHPVQGVSWEGALAYCAWADLRLPSEAEWEKAARGTDARIYPWGNHWDPHCATSVESLAGGIVHTTPVGSHPAGQSPCGGLDMSGNVWEWCASLYAGYPYDPDDGRENLGVDGPRVLRGGSWYCSALLLRASNRYRRFPYLREVPWLGYTCGFRVASSRPGRLASHALTFHQSEPRAMLQHAAPPVNPELDRRYQIRGGPWRSGPILGYPATSTRAARFPMAWETLADLLGPPPGTTWGIAPAAGVRETLARIRVRPGDRVADIGAGSGLFTFPLLDRVGLRGEVWATDVSRDALRFLQQRLPNRPRGNLHLVLHDVTSCLLPPGRLDLALLSDVHYFCYRHAEPGHTPPLDQVVAFYTSVRRALKPHGRLAVREIADLDLHPDPHRGVLTIADIDGQLSRAGLQRLRRGEAARPCQDGQHELLLYEPVPPR